MANHLLTDLAGFKSKNPNVPIGDQHKKFEPKDYRELRKFFKHATSEEIRQWIIAAMSNNKLYTETEVKKQSELIRQDYTKQMAEISKEKRDLKTILTDMESELDAATHANNQLHSDLNALRQYLMLPWYKRLFKSNPLNK